MESVTILSMIFLFILFGILYLPNIHTKDMNVTNEETNKIIPITPIKPKTNANSTKWYNNFGKNLKYPNTIK